MLCFAPVALCLLAPFTLVQEPEPPKEEPAFADPFGPQEIQSINLYGVRTVNAEAVRAALGLAAGDSTEFDKEAAVARLRAVPGVVDAAVLTVLMPGNAVLLVGVEERGTPKLALNAAPTGDARLPEQMLTLYDRTSELLMEGIMNGESGEELVDGYSVPKYAPMAAAQAELRTLALADPELVLRVLAESGDAKHRTVAAKAVAYFADKRAVVRALSRAMSDPDSSVRNNAVRALSIYTNWVSNLPATAVEGEPESARAAALRAEQVAILAEELDPEPLFTLLESLQWTDRNKSSALLASLVQLPNAALLTKLRAQSLLALAEMARWDSRGHALFSTRILARLAGRDSAEVTRADSEARAAGRLDALIDELVTQAAAAPGADRDGD